MGCRIHNLNLQFLYKKPPNYQAKTTRFSPYFSVQPSKRILFSPYNNLETQKPVSTITIDPIKIPESDSYNVKFKTLGSCKLGISIYPDFEYNAEGGTGTGTSTSTLDTDLNGEVSVVFNVKTLYIPPLSTATTKFLGLPLPTFLRIDIVPEVFKGNINRQTDKVDLNFSAQFLFSFGSIYRAPPLVVKTVLTSEESIGNIRKGSGERLNKDGLCRLVGVATVEPINDFFMDTFLSLPTECLANLNAEISFINIE